MSDILKQIDTLVDIARERGAKIEAMHIRMDKEKARVKTQAMLLNDIIDHIDEYSPEDLKDALRGIMETLYILGGHYGNGKRD